MTITLNDLTGWAGAVENATATAATTDGFVIPNDGNMLLVVSGGATPAAGGVVVTGVTSGDSLRNESVTIDPGANEDKYAGPFPTGLFGAFLNITIADATDLSVTPLSLGGGNGSPAAASGEAAFVSRYVAPSTAMQAIIDASAVFLDFTDVGGDESGNESFVPPSGVSTIVNKGTGANFTLDSDSFAPAHMSVGFESHDFLLLDKGERDSSGQRSARYEAAGLDLDFIHNGGDFSIVCVFRPDRKKSDDAAHQPIIGNKGVNFDEGFTLFQSDNDSKIGIGIADGSAWSGLDYGGSDGYFAWRKVEATGDGSNVSVSDDLTTFSAGDSFTAVPGAATDTVYLGGEDDASAGDTGFDGGIAMLLIKDGALTGPERTEVNSYISERFGI